jgi:hypothetical protein
MSELNDTRKLVDRIRFEIEDLMENMLETYEVGGVLSAIGRTFDKIWVGKKTCVVDIDYQLHEEDFTYVEFIELRSIGFEIYPFTFKEMM